jgi:hypothetical protein
MTATAVLHFSETSNGKIMMEGPGVNQDTAAQILHDSMVDAGKMYLKDVPVLVDVKVADNWYQK